MRAFTFRPPPTTATEIERRLAAPAAICFPLRGCCFARDLLFARVYRDRGANFADVQSSVGHLRQTDSQGRKAGRSPDMLSTSPLWFERSEIGRKCDHVVLGQLGDHLFHQFNPRAASIAGLHVVKLAENVSCR